MAGALTRRNAPPGATFSQQGQVDWVGLANHSVSFTVGVLSRLSKAGVDPLTVVVGRSLFRSMSLSPEGQDRVFKALSTLKSFSSFGQVIWFGFGVRHVVHELTGTEEGMTCVAISAALQVSYDSLFGAQVFRELSRCRDAPDSLLPSLHQWRALLHISAGVLTTSKFPRLLDGFARILAPARADSSLPQRLATAPAVIAQALCLLSDVASGRTASCTFAGGIDCAWVAAVAEWLYCLPIEILSEDSSKTYYRSSAIVPSSAHSPRILIIKSDDGSSPVSAISKAFILPSGGELIMASNKNDHQDLSSSCFQRRSEWAHILTDSFGEAVESLLEGQTGQNFAYLVRHAMNLGPSNALDDARSETLLDSDNETFSDFAGTRLPELKSCLDRPAVRQDHASWAEAAARNSLMFIRGACVCQNCNSQLFARRGYYSASIVGEVCLQKLANTILGLLRTLYNVAVDPYILPSHYHIIRMYGMLGDSITKGMTFPLTCIWGECRPFTVMKIFAGKDLDDIDIVTTRGWAAYTTEGLCAYYQLLENPNLSPKHAARIQLLPGCIEHHEIQYRLVEDLREQHDSKSPVWSGFVTRPSDRVDFIVQETAHSDKIGATYKIRPNTSLVRNSITPYSYGFPICQAVDYTKKFLHVRCQGNACSDPTVLKMVDEFGFPRKYNLTSWRPPPDTAKVIQQEWPEEQPTPSQVPAPGQQRHSVFENRRITSLSVLISTFSFVDSGPKEVQGKVPSGNDFSTYKLEIHKFPVVSGIDSEGDCSTPMTFARLYAEVIHANRAVSSSGSSMAFFGEFDDCAVCLIKLTIDYFKTQRNKQGYGFVQGEIIGTVVSYLANAEEHSRTGFMLKPAVDEDAGDLSSEPDSSASTEAWAQEDGS
jgi:hypothetical protein